MSTDQVAFDSGTHKVLFKDGKVCFSCCDGGSVGCPSDCTGCANVTVVISTPITEYCRLKFNCEEAGDLTGTFVLTRLPGTCIWQASVGECSGLTLLCYANFGESGHHWRLDFVGGEGDGIEPCVAFEMWNSGVVLTTCPPATITY